VLSITCTPGRMNPSSFTQQPWAQHVHVERT
jgi:hypothetical protein